MSFSLSALLVVSIMFLVQMLAALPWVIVLMLEPGELAVFRRSPQDRPAIWERLRKGLTAVGGAFLFGALVVFFIQRGLLTFSGYFYAAILQVQLTLDAFVLFFALALRVWPKGAAVGLSSFREGIRQPMFWLLMGFGLTALTVSPIIPYFTFGEDHLVVRELGYDTIMFVGALFGTLAASLFISEEIEGRTAVTLMSKPVSRRQFLLGKFLGIAGAALFMVGLLGVYFEGIILYKHWFDNLDPVPPPGWLSSLLGSMNLAPDSHTLLLGTGMWVQHTLETLPGLVLSFCQVMILVAIAVTLATRLPMVVNVSAVVFIYFLSNLAPVLVLMGKQAKETNPESTVAQLLGFTSQLFDTLLPGLSYFRLSPVLVSNAEVTAWPFVQYVASTTFHGVLYTSIVLLFGLILFEDRDLA